MMKAEERLYREIWEHKVTTKDDLAAEGSLRVSGALTLIDPGEKLLDVGCGEGTLGTLVSSRYKEVHGVDISPVAVELANQAGLIAHTVNINDEPLPYGDNTFDTVVSLDVIEHVFDPRDFLSEIHRVLKHGGHAVISTPNIRKLQRVWTLITGRFPRTSFDEVGYDGGHLHYFTSRDLSTLLTERGFQVVTIDGIMGDRRSWKYVTVVTLLGRRFEKEFLSNAILVKARKP